MKISLRDIERNCLWYLPGTSVHLTYDAPGPVEVDQSTLTAEQKTQIRLSVLSGDIITDDAKESSLAGEARSYATIKEIPKREPIKNILAESSSPLEEKTELFQTILAKSVATIKKSLPSLNISELRLVYSLEKNGKKRTPLLKSIQSLLDKHQKEVAESLSKLDLSVSTKSEEAFIKQGMRRDLWTNIEDVVESEQETIEFPLGARD